MKTSFPLLRPECRIGVASRGLLAHPILNTANETRPILISEIKDPLRLSCILGWGTKPNTKKVRVYAAKHNLPYISAEDGFLRSVGLGVSGSPLFSIVFDSRGIYYDATRSSDLEEMLESSDFQEDGALMETTRKAIREIREHHISKYNAAPDIEPGAISVSGRKRVLVVAQTLGDQSIRTGLAGGVSTDEILHAARNENPGAEICLKIHPDVLAGKKKSELNTRKAKAFCTIISEDVNPVSLLKHFDKVYTKTSQMGFEALLLGKEVVCFGMPFYAGWGVTDDRVACERRTKKRSVEEIFAAAYICYTHYFNPYTGKKSDIMETLYTLRKYRNISRRNAGTIFCFGFSGWKRAYIRSFFHSYQKNKILFCRSLEHAKKRGLNQNSSICIWGRVAFPKVEAFASSQAIQINRVEDGFVRSISLGSDLTQPYSLVVDSRGIYFDPTNESDLEHILSTTDFEKVPGLLERANEVRNQICKLRFSKYNGFRHGTIDIDLSKYEKVILVPGQVENDASMRFGGFGITNRSLLQRVRDENPDAYLIYKPHPDVVAGNRKGTINGSVLMSMCDKVVTNFSIDSCISVADEVHTITSLCGFDALLRGKKVFTYGLPFYSGWGLTVDKQVCKRRRRLLTIDELVASVLLLYPRYVHPKTGQFCELELLLEALKKEQSKFFLSPMYRFKKRCRDGVLRIIRRFWVMLTE
ncbi:MAG: hypothetical protein MI742_10655 [Desulfobacterales bacterium]|nr:hypothetical protein [Desulfobacterales bacterium]